MDNPATVVCEKLYGPVESLNGLTFFANGCLY